MASPLEERISAPPCPEPPTTIPDEEDTLYETPALGVFLTRGGELRRSLLAHQNVRPLEALADDLHGTDTAGLDLLAGTLPMRTLSASGGGDPANNAEKEIADTLKIVSQAFSVIPIIGTAVNIVISALGFLGLLGEEENPFDILYKRIEQRLQGILKATLAGQTLQTMQQLNALTGHAETAGSIVAGYLRNPTPAREALLPQADYWSLYAMNTLKGEALWLRTYDPDAATLKPGTSGWEFGPTVQPNLLMWDWRLPLLSYLKALAARIVVIRTIDPGVDAVHREEILGYARFLQGVEQRIRSGFSRSVPIPYPGFPHWMISARDSCGVVEVQSGAGDFQGTFVPAYWWRDPIETSYAQIHPHPTTYEEYLGWHRNGVETRYWRLYDSLGLFALWSIIPDVQTAARGVPGIHRDVKALLDLYKLSALTESSGIAKTRLRAYASWSEQHRGDA